MCGAVRSCSNINICFRLPIVDYQSDTLPNMGGNDIDVEIIRYIFKVGRCVAACKSWSFGIQDMAGVPRDFDFVK
jgi:hypothetical protein